MVPSLAGGFDPSATLPCRMPFCRRHRRKRAIYPTRARSLPFQPRVINSGNVARRSLTKFSGQSIPATQAGQAIAPLGQKQQIPFTFKKTIDPSIQNLLHKASSVFDDATWCSVVTERPCGFGCLRDDDDDTGNEKVIWFCGVHRNDPTSLRRFEVAIKILAGEGRSGASDDISRSLFPQPHRRSRINPTERGNKNEICHSSNTLARLKTDRAFLRARGEACLLFRGDSGSRTGSEVASLSCVDEGSYSICNS